MELQILKDMVLILGLAIGVLYIFHRLKIPSVIGFLITGVITGPHGLNLVSDLHAVEVIAEVGVIMLLFTIGIEFSLKSLLKIGKILIIGGSFQVLLTIGAITLVALRIGNELNESVFIGFLVALSSTAIVLKLIQDKGEIDAPHGRISLGVLIYQDPMIGPLANRKKGLAVQANPAKAQLELKVRGQVDQVFALTDGVGQACHEAFRAYFTAFESLCTGGRQAIRAA